MHISAPGARKGFWAVFTITVGLISCGGVDSASREKDAPVKTHPPAAADEARPSPASAPAPPRPVEAVKTAAAAPGGCGDCRDELISAHQASGRTFHCEDFTRSRGNEFFAYEQLKGQGSCEWSLIRDPLIVGSDRGYGLGLLRRAYGAERRVNSAYRDPARNRDAGGAPRSRHLFGDAADLRNEAAFAARTAAPEAWAREWALFLSSGNLEDRCLDLAEKGDHLLSKPCAEWLRMKDSAEKAGADYIEPLNLPCKLDCLHADWRARPGGYR
jgi:hypothetical protein